MADVAALFKKKKKKGKKKAKSFSSKLKEAGGQLPGQASQRNKEELEAEKNKQNNDTDLFVLNLRLKK